ncbi:DNA-binding protein [Sphingobacterium puteale]|uniref:DNA-binding protein n=1 Tax=Sphingobacterium puteale TaxID=2420510 RepID=A0A420VR49_9SPHI|nr:helix-turn-helix domain-containing protein [Sphingobacterium puteale]RKO68830.1 DNA-binding protein [Sphingobacterium puteale]
MNLSVCLYALIDRIEKLTEILVAIYGLLATLIHILKTKKIEQKPLRERKLWTHTEVTDYLGISVSTYKRRVREGVLNPMTLTGDDRYFEEDLIEALERSRLKGKI